MLLFKSAVDFEYLEVKKTNFFVYCLIRHGSAVDQYRGRHGFVSKYKIIHFRSVVEFKYLEVARES